MPFLLLLAACETAPTAPVRSPSPPPTSDGPVLLATVTRAPGPVPERFAVPPERWLEAEAPSIGRMRHALCTDAPGVRSAVLGALSSAPRSEVPWPGLDAGCREPGWCEWLATSLAESPSAPEREGLWWAALSCETPEMEALVNRSGPMDVVVSLAARTGRHDPRLEEIALLLVDQPSAALDWVLQVLAESDDPAAEASLVTLHRRAGPAVRDEIALSMWGRFGPEAPVLFREVCGRVTDDRCARVRPDRLTEVAERLEQGDLDPGDLFARFPNHRSAVGTALTACARNGYDRCLVALAREDRAVAAALAAELEIPGPLGRVLATSQAEVITAVAALGWPSLEVPADTDAVTVPELLGAAGHAVRLDDPFSWPPHHDQLLYALADIAGATDLAFDELPPSPFAPVIAGRESWVTLYAWADGWRWRTPVPGVEGWDTERAVGFLNAVLAARGSDRRLAIDLERGWVIAGTADALAALEDEGWVVFVRAAPPEVDGYTVTPTAGPPVTLEPVDPE